MIEVRVESWPDFIDLVTGPSFRNWAFRGQADATWKLWPTLARELRNRSVSPEFWLGQEGRILRIFQRKAFHFLPDVPPVGDTPRWLAMMQHHGAPTRMLDFTWSPYVAAFFALERAVQDAAVWAVNTRRLNTFAFGPELEAVLRPRSPTDWLESLEVGPQDVAFGEPYFMNRRLIAQSGTLAIPYDISRPIDATLGARDGVVAKIVIAGTDARAEFLQELYTMNVTSATLFPDLDGLARSLAYELEYHWNFDPRGTAEE